MVLRNADVFFKDSLAGTLVETASGGSRFTYDKGWTNGDIACCFPAAKREHEWNTGLHPFFQHLGTEGWLREQQARSAHVVEDDDLGLLLRYGADCIGAVSVRPSNLNEPFPEITEVTVNPGRTVSGVQKKLLVTLDEAGDFIPARSTGSASFIAKFNSESIHSLVRNEHLSLRWTAAVLGPSEVTQFRQTFISSLNETALVVTRFDRTSTGEKLRLEDCAQILCRPKGRDYGGKYLASYEDIAALIKNHSSRPQIDLLRFFRRLVAYSIVGNCDAHLKNFSLLETAHGLRLSPAYDVVNTAIYDGLDQRLALKIGGQDVNYGEANQQIFRRFGRAIGLPESAVNGSFAFLRRQVSKAGAVIRPPDAEPPNGFMNRFKEMVDNACLRILEP